MKKRRLVFIEPSKVGKYHITLLDGYITALVTSPALVQTFDIVVYLSKSTFENLPASARSRIDYRPIPVINQDKHYVVRKSLLEFLVMARVLFAMRKGDVVFVSCIIPTALLLVELLNRILRRRGLFVTIHGEEIEPFVEGRKENWRQLGFWGEEWLHFRKRNSLIDTVVIDDFIKDAFAEKCSDKLDPERTSVVHYPITRYSGAISPSAGELSVCFIGFRTRSKGFHEFERLSQTHSGVSFLAIGQGKVEDLRTTRTKSIAGIDDFLQAIAGCSAAVLPYTDSYTCILSASALDALSVGTHIIASDRPFFIDLAEYFGPDFVTIYRSTDELDAMLDDKHWLVERQAGQMRRLDALKTSRYSIDVVRADFERLFVSGQDDGQFKMSFQTSVRDVLAGYPRVDGIFRRFVWSRVHFPESELRLLNNLPAGKIDVAIDVGAALGPYSWILNRKARQTFAFEPGEVHGQYLELNFAGTNVTVVKAAVGDVTKTVEMFTAGADTNALHMATLSKTNPVSHQSNASVRHVAQVALDDYFENKLGADRTVDVLKVDVEGYETEVFKGAQALLRRHHPLIICEIEVRLNPHYAETFEVLRSLGYVSFRYLDGRYRELEGIDIAPHQTEEALKVRLSDRYVPSQNKYLNNFVFQHPNSRLNVC